MRCGVRPGTLADFRGDRDASQSSRSTRAEAGPGGICSVAVPPSRTSGLGDNSSAATSACSSSGSFSRVPASVRPCSEGGPLVEILHPRAIHPQNARASGFTSQALRGVALTCQARNAVPRAQTCVPGDTPFIYRQAASMATAIHRESLHWRLAGAGYPFAGGDGA